MNMNEKWWKSRISTEKSWPLQTLFAVMLVLERLELNGMSSHMEVKAENGMPSTDFSLNRQICSMQKGKPRFSFSIFPKIGSQLELESLPWSAAICMLLCYQVASLLELPVTYITTLVSRKTRTKTLAFYNMTWLMYPPKKWIMHDSMIAPY